MNPDSLAHVHLAEAEKERAKEVLGMKTVPFYVIIGQVRMERFPLCWFSRYSWAMKPYANEV